MHNNSNLFYFGTTLHVSEGLSVHHQESKTVHTGPGICHTVSVAAATEPVWHIPDDVCIVLDSWWWKDRLSETCTVLLQNKINLSYCASGWFYCRNILYSSLYLMHDEFFRIGTLITKLIYFFTLFIYYFLHSVVNTL